MAKTHPHRVTAVEAYKNGKPSEDVCQQFGISQSSLMRWCKLDGVPARGNQPLPYTRVSRNKAKPTQDYDYAKRGRPRAVLVDEAALVASYLMGYSAGKLAAHHRVNTMYVLRILRANRVTIRTSGHRTPKTLPQL